ncbi:MAG: hypothetical protein P8J59_05125 [Phycisphaerales bacterium]|jgi:hypothetical protein|nr:hypothetical protein [Phycisphaerales bacterium]
MTTNDDTVHGMGFTSASLSISGGAPLSGTATIFHLDDERFGEMHDLVELAISEEALEGRAASPMPAGASVSLGFEAPGTVARRGEVIQCDACGEGWRIGIRLASAA